MYTAVLIADEFLKIAKRGGNLLSPLQLMKLVYISHGWSLAILGRDLFSDRIEAWKYGPVIPNLYHATKHYGRNSIPLDKIGEPSDSKVDKETRIFLEDVFSKYGSLSGLQLSSLTHQEGTPWHKVFLPHVMGIEIPDSLIKEHYKELMLERKISTAAA